MNQMCRVCGEPAAGFHFGAFTCEGCKSFFGRTYSNHAALGECKNKGQCVINKKNRTSCKSCRLKKCYTVGMSKSGSRYGRRSNWFKIHCLIQNQAEMNNSLTDGNGLNGQLSQSFNENKNLVSQYKNERDTNSCSSAPNLPSNGASPNSSESSTRTLSSPYSSLFEAAKASGFTHRYNPSSPSISEKPTNKLINGNHCYPGPSLPLSPVSPLSPLNPASRFFFQSAASLFGNSAPKLLNTELGYLSTYSSRFLPLQSLNPVLKQSIIKEQSTKNSYEFYANEVPEQECPIDLSLKTSSSSICLSSCEKEDLLSSKQIIRDHDSGFSPSSNEENNNTSPLDLTSKKSPEPKTEPEDRSESLSASEDKKCPELNQNDNKAKAVVSI